MRVRAAYDEPRAQRQRPDPLGELTARLPDLPHEGEIVAYCRGPYGVLAPQAIEILRGAGFRARRLEDGLPEWRMAGLPVEIAS